MKLIISARPRFSRIQELRPQMLGGVTATPWRGDGFDLNQLLGRPLVQLGIADGLQRGFLSDVDYRLCADNLDCQSFKAAQGISILCLSSTVG